MAFNRLTFSRDWTKETDFPTYQDSEEQVREDLQYHPNALRDFINSLLAALEERTAAASIGAMNDDKAVTIQSVLNLYADKLADLAEDIRTVSGGGVPELVKSTAVTFAQESWINTSSGVSMTIAKTEHKRDSENFGYTIYQLADGIYQGGAGSAALTRVICNADGSITLTADEAYSGKIVFFGM